MGNYTEVWREIEQRLRAALSLLHADAPVAAANVDGATIEWLDHNEFELALDELRIGAEDAGLLRRRFWEELLTAAMLMRLEHQFLQIAEGIVGLEPHAFGATGEPPRVWCDFNGMIEPTLYSINAVGTALDMARLRLPVALGQQLVLYSADENEGAPAWLLVDAELLEYPPWGLVAKVLPESFRWERR